MSARKIVQQVYAANWRLAFICCLSRLLPDFWAFLPARATTLCCTALRLCSTIVCCTCRGSGACTHQKGHNAMPQCPAQLSPLLHNCVLHLPRIRSLHTIKDDQRGYAFPRYIHLSCTAPVCQPSASKRFPATEPTSAGPALLPAALPSCTSLAGGSHLQTPLATP